MDTICQRATIVISQTKNRVLPIRKRVYEDLKTAILSGRLDPEERLTEEHLAETLGVSRTPVREALYKLESEGLVHALETRGFIVGGDSVEEMAELFEIRAVLEGFALRICAERITGEVLGKLNTFVEKAEAALKARFFAGTPDFTILCTSWLKIERVFIA